MIHSSDARQTQVKLHESCREQEQLSFECIKRWVSGTTEQSQNTPHHTRAVAHLG